MNEWHLHLDVSQPTIKQLSFHSATFALILQIPLFLLPPRSCSFDFFFPPDSWGNSCLPFLSLPASREFTHPASHTHTHLLYTAAAAYVCHGRPTFFFFSAFLLSPAKGQCFPHTNTHTLTHSRTPILTEDVCEEKSEHPPILGTHNCPV